MASSYDYCGLVLSADLVLRELPGRGNNRSADLHVITSERATRRPVSWDHHWMVSSGVALSLGRADDRYVLRFEDGSLFDFFADTRTIGIHPPQAEAFPHQLLDHVLPRVLDHLGHTMIHGSAIDTPNGAVVFVGETGRGKSTLAASFQRAGGDLLSDDCLRLEIGDDGGVICTPTYRSLRLWPDSAGAVMPNTAFAPMSADSDKRRLDLPDARPSGGRCSVAAICVLAAPDEVSGAVTIERLAPARAVSLLLAQCFRLDPTAAEATERAFERCVDVVERVPVVGLSYPRAFDRLRDVRDAVLDRAVSGDWSAVSSA